MRHRWPATLAVLALTCGSVLAATGVAEASAPAVRAGSEWAGYSATGAGTYTSVSSDWTEPTAHCSSGDPSASFWVGLDGASSPTVEQIGSLIECTGKTPTYIGWYELYPANPEYFSNTIKPGDQLSASVTYEGSNKFTLTLADVTGGWTQTVTKSLSAERSSAEIITEVSDSGASPPPTTFFGQVDYTGAMVNGLGLCKASPVANSTPDLTVSAITGCTNFTVTQT